MHFKEKIESRLSQKIESIQPLHGGDINDTFRIKTPGNTFALKVNRKDTFPGMFEKEKSGLESISKSGARTPEVILVFSDVEYQFLILEFIEESPVDSSFWKNFAKDLAKIHQTHENYFGLEYDNYIGSLPQDNLQKPLWESFFIENRLIPLIKSAFDENLLQAKHLKSFENFYKKVNEIIPQEQASLVHGDLWAGNLMKSKNTPFFIDPAIYYGHREVDIAMTQMFGGFDNSYLQIYNELFPLIKGWEKRIKIHNLYPNLVHLNLFGSAYLSGIENVIKRF